MSAAHRDAQKTTETQHTLGADARVEGIGLFSGVGAVLTMHPAPADHGLVFMRSDLPGRPTVPVSAEFNDPQPRRTALRRGEASVHTVEHVLSALRGLGVDNALLELAGPEVPADDGSAKVFTEALRRAGVVDQGVPRRTIRLTAPVAVEDRGAKITYLPPQNGDTGLTLTYELSFERGTSPVPAHRVTETISPERYAAAVAPARTFSSRAEAEEASKAGLFRHLTVRDMLVIDEHGPVDNSYRFQDEPARHKLLDLLGDLALAGAPIRGTIIAERSGHALNHTFAAMLKEKAQMPTSTPSDQGAAVPQDRSGDAAKPALGMDIRRIMEVLPHRYPMVMVDRVVELEPGVRAVGLKNVTINEPFFTGHYPTAPIMPGVLMLEAMGQLAGLMLANVLDHKGKVALLMAMDEVRFRRPVVPGDQLRIYAVSNKATARLADVSCEVRVEGQLVAEARLKFMMVDPSQVKSTSPAG